MNANFGIVLRKQDRELAFSQLTPRIRTWGGETVDEDRPHRYVFAGLEGIEFEVFPVTKFIRELLPVSEQELDLEYVWMTGDGLDCYASWAKMHDEGASAASFETGLASLLGRLGFWAVVFAPEGERLGKLVKVSVDQLTHILRYEIRNLTASEGFLAVSA